MDCREAQTLLTAFHDGELPDADRTRVENHLRGCPECGRLLVDLARADEVAGVPDPGPGYWDQFNTRVADRIGQESEGPRVAVLRPKHGWMRQQLRFLVPAVAAAALVVVVVRYGGRNPVAPKAIHPPVVSVTEQSALDSAGQHVAKGEMEPPAKGKTEDAAVSRSLPAKSNRASEAPAVSPPPIATERFPTVAREERDRLADRPPVEGKERASRDRVAAPTGIETPSSRPLPTVRSAPAASPPVTVADERLPNAQQAEGKKMAEAALPVTEPKLAATTESGSVLGTEKDQSAEESPQTTSVGNSIGKAGPSPLSSELTRASSPCERARTLAAQERWKEAETSQRECLAQNPSPPIQEKGLIFLAELLDRQARFAEADAVLTEVHRQFPKSLPLDLYRQQRPMVQKQQTPSPVIR